MISGGAPVAAPQRHTQDTSQADNSEDKLCRWQLPIARRSSIRGSLWPYELGLITPVACWVLAMDREGTE